MTPKLLHVHIRGLAVRPRFGARCIHGISSTAARLRERFSGAE